MARPAEVVIDASVACQWFLSEPGTPQALALRDAHNDGRIRLIAPELMTYEVGNALRFVNFMTAEQVKAAVDFFFDEQVGLVRSTRADLREASDFAYGLDLTIYDAAYAILAERRRCPLVMDDRKLLKASPRARPLFQWSVES